MALATVAVLGNPNCGKTTLFNALTGAKQQVGNWPGVTVEKKTGSYSWQGSAVELVDLPGTYSLDVGIGQTSLDEKLARDYILSNDADLYINIIDASNIERNLYLTTQLLEMNRPMLVVLNMMDVAEEKGIRIDIPALSRKLGCTVLPFIASRGQGADDLKRKIAQYLSGSVQDERITVTFSDVIEKAMHTLEPVTSKAAARLQVSHRWVSGRLLEGDQSLATMMSADDMARVQSAAAAIEEQKEEEVDIIFADDRYSFISDITDGIVARKRKVSRSTTDKIDSVVLNRVLGLPVFFAVMYLMFMFTINVGGAFIDFFDILSGTIFVDGTRHLLEAISAPELLITLLADGVGGGIQTVSTFIPVIGCLFLFLSVLEDSGYMARAAFVMDRAMRTMGLPGKAFVPILVGFGCNVPAIMATRTLEQERDRKLTILMSPFMSCGARLPVYALFAVVFFPATGQNVVFALYLAGILAAVVTGLIMKHTLLPGNITPFVMELPRYHMPTVHGMLLRTWDRLKSFIVKAGKTIVVMVLVISFLNSLGTDGSFGNENTDKSVLTRIGQTITPAFAPMGMQEDNWPAAVGIFTGVFAKEAVVGTLDAVYSNMAADTEGDAGEYDLFGGIAEAWATIPENLAGLAGTATDPLGMAVGTTDNVEVAAEEQGVTLSTYDVIRAQFGSQEAAFAYLLFILLYVPCVAAMGAVHREAGAGWMWMVGGWSTFVAYVTATVYFQIMTFSANPASAAMWLGVMTVAVAGVLFVLRQQGQKHSKVFSASVAGASGAE